MTKEEERRVRALELALTLHQGTRDPNLILESAQEFYLFIARGLSVN